MARTSKRLMLWFWLAGLPTLRTPNEHFFDRA